MYKRILTVRERENYVSKKIHIENFRLLMDYDVDFDEELTLFVGKKFEEELWKYETKYWSINEQIRKIHKKW